MQIENFKKSIVQEYFDKEQQKRKNKIDSQYEFSEDREYQEMKNKQIEIEYAKHLNITNSFTKMLEKKKGITMLFITGTFPSDFSIEKYNQSVESISNHLKWQSKSISFFMRKLFKSKKYKRIEPKYCALNDPMEYLWSVELQEKGDMHFHAVIFIKDDDAMVKHFIKRFHLLRSKYPKIMQVSDSGKKFTILPLGRCHIGLHPKFKTAINEISSFDIRADMKDSSRKHYFLKDLSHIAIVTGQGTALEFYSKSRLEEAYTDAIEYANKITKAKHSPIKQEKLLKTLIHKTMIDHHTKGTSEKYNNEKLKVDAMVFSYIGVRTTHYSQLLFPTKLYQIIRNELIYFQKKYRSLYEVTIDRCKNSLQIKGKTPYRTVEYNGKIIAEEQRWKDDISSENEERNQYAKVKGGE